MTYNPKVLLLCSFSQSTANGITIRNLCKGWPINQIALAEFNDNPEEVCVPEIKRYYFLGNKEVRFLAPFHLLRKFKPSYMFQSKDEWKITECGSQTPSGGTLLKRGAASRVKKVLLVAQRAFLNSTGLAMVSRKFSFSTQFDEWVREFNPDIIYASAGDICKLEFITAASKRYNARLAIHIFDDYLASKHEGTLFPTYWKKRLDRTFRSVCNFASLHLAIGDKMAEEYTERYGHKFYGFHNPIDPEVWCKIEKEEDGASGKMRKSEIGGECPAFKFLYAGKINKDTVGPIRRFIEAVERLKAQGHFIRFGIHSPYPFEEIERLLGSEAKEVYLGKIPYAELPAAYRAADGLLLPLDFTEATIRYIRLSMLTKASEYMISGTPIFCFAPQQIAVSEYLLEHDAAIHCGDPEALELAILNFIEDKETRKRVAWNAVERAKSHHMMGHVNERLRRLIRQATEESGRLGS